MKVYLSIEALDEYTEYYNPEMEVLDNLSECVYNHCKHYEIELNDDWIIPSNYQGE